MSENSSQLNGNTYNNLHQKYEKPEGSVVLYSQPEQYECRQKAQIPVRPPLTIFLRLILWSNRAMHFNKKEQFVADSF